MHCYLFPPQNYLAEEILLGTVLINPSIFPQITPIIKPESFFLEGHQIIYKNLIEIHQKNKLDTIQLMYSLSNANTLDIIGGIEKIIELMKQSQIFMSSRNIIIYVKELVEVINHDYIKRLMIQYGYNIIGLAYIKKFPSYQLYNQATNYLNITVQKMPKENMDNFKTLIGKFLLNLNNPEKQEEELKEKVNSEYFIISGFQDLDQLTNGLPNGDLIVVAGRPSTGKTSFAINIVYNIITNFDIGICIFSLEMSKMQILQKLISIASTVPTRQIILNKISDKEWISIRKICKKLLSSSIYLNDTPNMSVDYIEYTSKLLKKETNCADLVVIDYLQLIQVDNISNDGRTQELSYITRKLKLLAQNLNIPIIILSQLNRSIETRANKQPLLSDLRESGCLNNSVLINNDNINCLNIKNIININIEKTIYSKAYILLQYIFKLNINYYNHLFITQNHKIYTRLKWIKQNHLLENIKILKKKTLYNNNYILEELYLKSSISISYTTVYDIEVHESVYFIGQNILLHNSIEQDADIVMMLYQKEKNKHEQSNIKILDITVCKNRNGPTGSCQILFSLDNTIFMNLQNKVIFNSCIDNEY